MTLSGAIAILRPDVDRPARHLPDVVTHGMQPVGKNGTYAKFARAGANSGGTVSKTTGSFTATVNTMTEPERRANGLRRNGRTKRRR